MVAKTSRYSKGFKLQVILTDSEAIEIIKRIPEERRSEAIEKYIRIGDMVLSHASISTSKETIEQFFQPLRTDIETIREQLRLIVPTIATPASKGAVTVETIYNDLEKHFLDDSFEDVTAIGKFADIRATIGDTKRHALIEVKDYSNPVPTSEIDKFWRDMELRDVKYGILVSMRSKIVGTSCAIKLETRMGRTAVLVVDHETNWSGHIFAFYIIKKMMELEGKKAEELKGKALSSVLLKINKNLVEIQKDLKLIDELQEISEGLKTTCKNKLDKITDLSNSYKRLVNEKIDGAFKEMEGVELK